MTRLALGLIFVLAGCSAHEVPVPCGGLPPDRLMHRAALPAGDVTDGGTLTPAACQQICAPLPNCEILGQDGGVTVLCHYQCFG